ncbi:DegV family protein [Helcococcus kunzii]|uniref:DegV family EDD domain-containing protein n=1 Tax=Helcococcus kunzii ATCC 51366 TaxID=883114 RepID=H3NNY2_9FIRM|nr:DegV family protein [Helcococcus kunzii]EHR34107.1 DegV family EDD domain-containing protein [Helcococcus kunzii ATCC 51366]MCT1795716.1 DegV family EDD domain-containing protein [Helcococcus kunzii]MCT1988677.1 DegV family EDD domain-containing protein [Helcococcus kunzii]QUY64955.1 DegV family EDD domain-containing protein [Helcococcus kunzii]QZO75662.1 DegV family EDD domain-containing protein [Helcococcus kunzii]
MKKIILSSDSTSDLSKELMSKYQIFTLPLYIHLDNKEYKDMIDIDANFIYKYFDEHKVLPKTSAPSVGDYLRHFGNWNYDEYEIIHVSIGSSLSSSYQNAVIAAEELGNVHVIDSKSLSTGSGLLLLIARDMIEDGKNTDEIVEEITRLTDKLNVSFVIDSITYLREGGRLSALRAFGANVLNIKPSISVSNKDHGKMNVGKKYRGKIDVVVNKYITDTLSNDENIDKRIVSLTHSGATEEQIQNCINAIKENCDFEEILVNKASSTIASHCGYNTFGLIFFNK